MGAIEAAIAEGWEVLVCLQGHTVLWPTLDIVGHRELDPEDWPPYQCGMCLERGQPSIVLWWLFDDRAVEAAFLAGGVDAAVAAWVDRAPTLLAQVLR